jgi:hypothetical protein
MSLAKVGNTCMQWCTINAVGGLSYVFTKLLNKCEVFLYVFIYFYFIYIYFHCIVLIIHIISTYMISFYLYYLQVTNLPEFHKQIDEHYKTGRPIMTISNHSCNIDDPLLWGIMLKARFVHPPPSFFKTGAYRDYIEPFA